MIAYIESPVNYHDPKGIGVLHQSYKRKIPWDVKIVLCQIKVQ